MTGCAGSVGTLCVPATAVAAVLIANGLDDVATGVSNFGVNHKDQQISAILNQYGVSEEDAAQIKLALSSASLAGEVTTAAMVTIKLPNTAATIQNPYSKLTTTAGVADEAKTATSNVFAKYPETTELPQNYSTVSTQAAKNTETYFRVEGGGSGNKTSQNRITVNGDGTITINPGCTGQLCVSTLGADHAKYYLSEKRPGGNVVVFEVDAKTHKEIMDSLVPQKPLPGTKNPPNAPKITDVNTPGLSIELPEIWNKVLEENSSKARVLTQEQFYKEFGQYEKK